MTTGVFLPAITALFAVVELIFFARRKANLPTRMDPDYDEEGVNAQRRSLTIVMFASALLPVLLWLVLNVFVPDVGSIELF